VCVRDVDTLHFHFPPSTLALSRASLGVCVCLWVCVFVFGCVCLSLGVCVCLWVCVFVFGCVCLSLGLISDCMK